jgi:hypothetical protein
MKTKIIIYSLPIFIALFLLHGFNLQNKKNESNIMSVTICRDVNIPIPDNGGNENPAIDTLVVNGLPFLVPNVIKITIDTLYHTWIGDLRGWITKDNVTDTLFSRIGRPLCGATFGNQCNNLIGTNLKDSVGLSNIQNIPCSCIGVNAQATGTFNPKDPLNVFQNENPNGMYIFKVSDHALGDSGTIRRWCINFPMITSINDPTVVINDYKLYQNYPNPFNPETIISYEIPVESEVKLRVFDILGKEVAVLVNERQNAGRFNYRLSIENNQLTGGIYFYKLEARQTGSLIQDFIQTKRLMLIK